MSPGTSKIGHFVEPRGTWKDLFTKTKTDDLRIYDLRRTPETISLASTAIVGRTLEHKSPEATAVYARLNLDPVRASMETVTTAMLAMKNVPDKMVDIKK